MMATQESAAEKLKILIVDDEGITLSAALEANNFTVTTAGAVNDALTSLTPKFSMFCSPIFTCRGRRFHGCAMRHNYPDAVTLVYSGYPALKEAMTAIAGLRRI